MSLFTRIALVVVVASSLSSVGLADWPPAAALERPEDGHIGELPPSVTAEPRGNGLWDVTFRYRPADSYDAVSLAGSFNGWNPNREPMTRSGSGSVWTHTTLLGPGQYEYKFVINGNQWIPDPLNPEKVDDNHQGFNSVLNLGRLASMGHSRCKTGDELIDAAGLMHSPYEPLYFQALSTSEVLIRYRTFAHDIAKVWVAVKGGKTVPMHQAMEERLFTTWEAHVAVPDGAKQIEYTFVLADPGKKVCDPETYTAACDEAHVFKTPDWARHAVWYQIMPDRFRNGNMDNDPDPKRPWTSEWFTPSPGEERDGWTFYKYYVFFRLYGGDFEGVQEEFPYLKKLGVNALYFNPVFQAPTHHKYDTDNFLHVDEHLGGGNDYDEIVAQEDLNDPSTWKWTTADKRFLAFIKAAHEAGFHVIIDGVFNHVGRNHPAFRDVVENGPNSKYAQWFDIVSWEPFKYRGWAGVADLPAFKKSSDGLACDEVTQHIFNVTRRWMDPDGDGDPSDGIDGWRLDVPNEIPHPFWAEWRKVVKGVNPDAYIVGEIWDRADTWLDGKHFDAVMNYEFARAAVAWICHKQQKITPTAIDEQLAKLRLAYPSAATYVLQNLVDSHDTDRLVSMALNPDRGYDQRNRVQDSNPHYDNSKPGPEEYQRARLVVLLQMTYVGAPMVYYGDEAGMWGADDPTNRKPMLWKDLEPYDKPDENFVMEDHLAFYQAAIALRDENPALQTGSFETLLTDDDADVWAFLRSNDQQYLVVALNASSDVQTVKIPVPAELRGLKWEVAFGDDGACQKSAAESLTVKIGPISGVVLRASR